MVARRFAPAGLNFPFFQLPPPEAILITTLLFWLLLLWLSRQSNIGVPIRKPTARVKHHQRHVVFIR